MTMLDSPGTPETHRDYLRHVMQPLAQGQSVAAFLTLDAAGEETVVFIPVALSGRTQAASVHEAAGMRVGAQLRVQGFARAWAVENGYEPTVA